MSDARFALMLAVWGWLLLAVGVGGIGMLWHCIRKRDVPAACVSGYMVFAGLFCGYCFLWLSR